MADKRQGCDSQAQMCSEPRPVSLMCEVDMTRRPVLMGADLERENSSQGLSVRKQKTSSAKRNLLLSRVALGAGLHSLFVWQLLGVPAACLVLL